MIMTTDGLQMARLLQARLLQTNKTLRLNNNNKKWLTLWSKLIMLAFKISKIREQARDKPKSIEITMIVMKTIIMATMVKALTVCLLLVISKSKAIWICHTDINKHNQTSGNRNIIFKTLISFLREILDQPATQLLKLINKDQVTQWCYRAIWRQ